MGLAAPRGGHREPLAHLDPLDCLDAHQGAGEEPVELAVPVDVATEPDRDAVGQDLDHTAERVAALAAASIASTIAASARGRSTARQSVDGVEIPARAGLRRATTGPRATTCESTVGAKVLEQELGHGAGSHPGGGLRADARSRTSRASVKPYFCIPVRSAWPGRGWVSGAAVAPGAGDISSAHLRLPLRVGDLDRHRGAEGAAVADAPHEDVRSSCSKRMRGPRRIPGDGGPARPGCPRW